MAPMLKIIGMLFKSMMNSSIYCSELKVRGKRQNKTPKERHSAHCRLMLARLTSGLGKAWVLSTYLPIVDIKR